MAEQSDFAMKFSTLNVNAMEFVPNFGSPPNDTPAEDTTDAPANPAAPAETETATSSPSKSATPSEQPSPTKSETVAEPAVVAVATPTEQLTDKSPAGL